MDSNATPSPAENELVYSRQFPVPVGRLFEAFRNPEKLQLWWGPNGFTSEFETFEFEAGGTWKFIMRGPDGTEYPNDSRFVEIVPDRLIVFDHVCPPHFRMTMTYGPAPEDRDESVLTWRMAFETAELCRKLRPICDPANVENFDRLQSFFPGNAAD
ncbi:MAG: SRPBCC domain-containing protein [Verrucomicrobiae bacterium]|nr:SRPBCC domain-containing protein [Verrucomicrobiae bacterium]